MTTVSTHVLDTMRGVPASGITVALFALEGDRRSELARGVTDAEGRTNVGLARVERTGTYELVFSVGAYFRGLETAAFYDEIPVRFTLDARLGHYHVPLLLAPWSYATYRGS